MMKELETLLQHVRLLSIRFPHLSSCQFSAVIEQLHRVNESTGRTNVHVVQRYRDMYHDYSQEYKKTKSKLFSQREQAELLGSVRKDIKYFFCCILGLSPRPPARTKLGQGLRRCCVREVPFTGRCQGQTTLSSISSAFFWS